MPSQLDDLWALQIMYMGKKHAGTVDGTKPRRAAAAPSVEVIE